MTNEAVFSPAQHGGEADELPGRGSCGVAVIQHRQQVHQHGGAGRAEEDEGHPAADFGARAVGERAEQRQQEHAQQCKDQQRDGEGRQPRNEQHSQDDRKADAEQDRLGQSPGDAERQCHELYGQNDHSDDKQCENTMTSFFLCFRASL